MRHQHVKVFLEILVCSLQECCLITSLVQCPEQRSMTGTDTATDLRGGRNLYGEPECQALLGGWGDGGRKDRQGPCSQSLGAGGEKDNRKGDKPETRDLLREARVLSETKQDEVDG